MTQQENFSFDGFKRKGRSTSLIGGCVKKYIMEWIIVENFIENIDKHVELITTLAREKAYFLVRKEWLDFEELNQKQKNEIIEENYNLYKNNLLFFEKSDTKKKIDAEIIEIARTLESVSINEKDQDISCILNAIEEKEDPKYLLQIKNLITDLFHQLDTKKAILNPNNYFCRMNKNLSYKFYNSDGELDNGSQYFDWYKLDKLSEVKEFIENNSFNYNIIVTRHIDFEKQYLYYINFYEGSSFVLAVRDNNGDFNNIFREIFKDKYVRYINENMEIRSLHWKKGK